jgi:hypothetical protein
MGNYLALLDRGERGKPLLFHTFYEIIVQNWSVKLKGGPLILIRNKVGV